MGNGTAGWLPGALVCAAAHSAPQATTSTISTRRNARQSETLAVRTRAAVIARCSSPGTRSSGSSRSKRPDASGIGSTPQRSCKRGQRRPSYRNSQDSLWCGIDFGRPLRLPPRIPRAAPARRDGARLGVPRSRLGEQSVSRICYQTDWRPAEGPADVLQNASLIGTMSDGRSRNGGIRTEDTKPVEQVFAKHAALDGFAQVAVRGGDDADARFQQVRPAEPLELALLQNAQALGLRRQARRLLPDRPEEDVKPDGLSLSV